MNVPKLRFKEFNDEWQKINIGNMFEYFSTNSLSRDCLTDKGMIKNIHYGDIHKIYKSTLNISDINCYLKDNNIATKYQTCKSGDLIIADASEDYDGIGKATELVNIADEIVISGLHTILSRDTTNSFSLGFKGYYFNSPNIHNQIRILANGFKVFGISKDTINKLKAYIPSKEEQNKIVKTLSLLDKKIELQTKKIEDLKLFKLCNMKNIFNSNIFFQKKISDLAQVIKGKQFNNELLIENGKYYMLNGGITPSGRTNQYNTEENTITISEGGNSCGYVNFNQEKFWCGGHCYAIKPFNINNNYLYQLLKFNENNIMNLRVGSGLPNIQKKDLENYILNIHNEIIQNKIANLFDSFDYKIKLEEEKLNKLISLKKGLMQNMFA